MSCTVRTCSCRSGGDPSVGTAGRATPFSPVRDWWPGHIKPPRTSFVSARNAARMWKL
jgi:hypothetical protein